LVLVLVLVLVLIFQPAGRTRTEHQAPSTQHGNRV